MKTIFQISPCAMILLTIFVELAQSCIVSGPLFPVFKLQAKDKAFKPMLQELNSIAKKLVTADEFKDSMNPDVTSFSIQVTLAQETLWTNHYTAPAQGNYSDVKSVKVSGDTVFRIASISKTFTVLALLLKEGRVNFDDPITKHLPELLEGPPGSENVQWSDITLRSLASQLSGISRECVCKPRDKTENTVDKSDIDGALDLLTLGPSQDDAIDRGLPPVPPEEVSPCGNHTVNADCTPKEFIRGVREQTPVFQPNGQATYSNDAFVLLGLALMKITGKSYKDSIKEAIFEPLHMNKSSLTRPPDSAGIIPAVENFWNWDSPITQPTGGIFSTTNDLSAYLRAILSHKQLSVAQTNAWLKPNSFNPGLHSAYGMPWEIIRTTKTSLDGRTIDLYLKGGGLPGYFSYIILVPEYGLGITILTAGKQGALNELLERLGTPLLQHMEKLLRAKTEAVYAGVYRAAHLNSSIDIAVHPAGGLYARHWISNGTNFLDTLAKMTGVPFLNNNKTLQHKRAVLIPTNLDAAADTEMWRVLLQDTAPEEESHFPDVCVNDVNFLRYGGRILNEVLFKKKDGGIVGLEMPGLRVEMAKERKSLFGAYLGRPLQLLFGQ